MVVQPRKERDRTWDMDKRVDQIDRLQQHGPRQEVRLDSGLKENVEPLLETDEGERMLTGCDYSIRLKSDGAEGAGELVGPVDQ